MCNERKPNRWATSHGRTTIKEGYRKYTGKELISFIIKIFVNIIGNCVRGNPEVFEVGRKPWIIPNNGSVENDMIVVDSCPSGALKYIRKAGNEYAN